MFLKLFLIISLILIPKISFGHTDHYKNYKLIKMEIFRNDKLIGFSNFFFSAHNDILKVKNQLSITVSMFGSDIFKLESYGVEKYKNNKLISFESKTLQNDKEKFVNMRFDSKSNMFKIRGTSFTGEATTDNIVGNWWNHKLLSTNTQISPVSGSIKKQVVTFLGKETIELYGKRFDADHFKLQSMDMKLPKDKRLNFDIWIDKKNSIILKVVYSRMGLWEYRLKSFN